MMELTSLRNGSIEKKWERALARFLSRREKFKEKERAIKQELEKASKFWNGIDKVLEERKQKKER